MLRTLVKRGRMQVLVRPQIMNLFLFLPFICFSTAPVKCTSDIICWEKMPRESFVFQHCFTMYYTNVKLNLHKISEELIWTERIFKNANEIKKNYLSFSTWMSLKTKDLILMVFCCM